MVTKVSTTQEANLDLVTRVGPLIASGFEGGAEDDLFADGFVFHFFNPTLPELTGDHHGADGLARFFSAVHGDISFENHPHSLTPYGDELVVAYATNTVEVGGSKLDVDAIVVWRVFDGRIHEAWDIPAINTVRPHRSDASAREVSGQPVAGEVRNT